MGNEDTPLTKLFGETPQQHPPFCRHVVYQGMIYWFETGLCERLEIYSGQTINTDQYAMLYEANHTASS